MDMKRFVIMLGAALAVLLLGAAGQLGPPPGPGHPVRHNTYQHVYALAGDSIFGSAYLPVQDRMVTQLAGVFAAAEVGDAHPSVVTDHAVGGQRLVGGASNNLIDLWPGILSSSPRPTTIPVEIGTNDLFGSSDQQFEAAYLQLASQAAAAGVTILPCLITPLRQATFGAREPQLERLNAWLVATFGADFVVDLWTPLLQPGTHDLAAAFDSGDGMHPNAAGVAVMARAVYARR